MTTSPLRLAVDCSGPFPRLLLDGAQIEVHPYLRSCEKCSGREGTIFAMANQELVALHSAAPP